jgi:3D (Asp-Asp-Asp) domain-containing protein
MKFVRKWMVLAVSLVLAGLVATIPTVTNAESINQPLHKGMHDASVKPLQHQLKSFAYYKDDVDGVFGLHTYQAVNDFQRDHGLRVDGIAGANTKKALKKMHALKQTYKKAGLMGHGDRGKAVKTLQNQLKNLNYYNGNLDGIYGPLTEGAVKAFQQANHIAVDGIAGPSTYLALIHNPVRRTEENVEAKKTSLSGQSSHKTAVKSVHTKEVNSTDSGDKNTVETAANVSENVNEQSGKTLYMEATAYTAYCPGCSGVTATGINLKENPGAKVIAVDPGVIPLGSKVWVEGYGYAVAGDTGGAIKGRRIDLFMPSHAAASSYGRKTVRVKIYR